MKMGDNKRHIIKWLQWFMKNKVADLVPLWSLPHISIAQAVTQIPENSLKDDALWKMAAVKSFLYNQKSGASWPGITMNLLLESLRSKSIRAYLLALSACILWASVVSSTGARAVDASRPASLVTPAVLESKIAETEATTSLAEEAKARLVELYRKALSHLEAARANQESAAVYQSTAETAPAQIQAIRASLKPDAQPAPLEDLDANASTPLRELEQLLQKEQADLTAVDARRADIESRLSVMEQRPAAISRRLAEATQQREEVSAKLQSPPADGAGSALVQAGRWALETRYQALSTAIKKLDQELLSRSLRMQLLEAKRDKEQAGIAWISERVKALNERIGHKRQQAAEQAQAEAARTKRETAGMDPVLVRLSEQNAALSEEVNFVTERLRELDLAQERAERLAQRLAADYQDARETLESGEVTGDLGGILLEQRDALPDLKAFFRNAEVRKLEIADLNTRRLRHRAEARRIADTDATVDALAEKLQADATETADLRNRLAAQRARLRDLVEQRQGQLTKGLEIDGIYLGKLREVDTAEDALLATAAEHDDFLREHLLWLRSAEPTRLRDLRSMPSELHSQLVAADVPGLMRLIAHRLSRSIGFWLALIGAAALLWQRRSLITAIEAAAARVGKPTTDKLAHTWRALALTLLVAAPLPLVLAAAGWLLRIDGQGTELSIALGDTLTPVALHLYILRTLHAVCLPCGLAEVHFRWPKRNLVLLRVQVDRLAWLYVPAALLANLAVDLNPAQTGGTLARLMLLLGYGALSWFLFRVFHPKRGVLAQLRLRDDYPLVFRTYLLWYPLAVIYPLVLVYLGFTGYMYSAASESYMFQYTLWLILALVLVNALALRWLQLTRRRLAYDAAMERRRLAREAAQAEDQEVAGEGGELLFEEPEVDISALSEETRGLIRILLIVATVVGFYLIWASALPALRILDVVMWHETLTVDGEDRRLPITLADLGLGLLYVLGTWILAKRLPAVIEIILLQRFEVTAASRYTVTTLTTYAIVVVGVLLVLGTLGLHWSQLQWLAAALTVGIGFGLQEIVANFISGLIILFERPIRVGDAVTVGDTDGIVTKIKIRATTIRNWDGKELLVPNKEFITGRLLNWSLTDQTTRLVLSVGIAYGSPVREAMNLLEEAAKENQDVLDDPAPTVIFETFGDNSLGLLLRCFVDSVEQRYLVMSALNEAINDKFNAAGITIAFPQRDLHLDTIRPLRVQIEGDFQTN